MLYRGFEASHKLAGALRDFPRNSRRAFGELAARLSSKRQVLVLGKHVEEAASAVLQKARSFVLQVSDFLAVRVLGKQEAFRVLKRTLNFDPDKLAFARLKYDTFLDYYLPESHLECHPKHLRVDDYYVKVLTLKEPAAQSFPLIFKRLLEVEANYHVVTEWKREDSGKMRRTIQAKRRHFHNTKRSFLSHVSLADAPAQDVLLDDSRESQVRELGEGVKEIELHGNHFGLFSLTVAIYDLDPGKVDRACAAFYKVFNRTILILRGKTKNAKRSLSMTKEVFELLKARRQKRPNDYWVFPSPRKPGDHLSSVRKSHDRVCEKMGLKGLVDLYNLRHTFATRSILSGTDVTILQKILGHSEIEMTMRYVKIAEHYKVEAVEKMEKYRAVQMHEAEMRLGMIQ